MSLVSAFSKLFGGWFGDVYPVKTPVPLVAVDAREHALSAFADFLAELEFSNPQSLQKPRFQIPREQVHTEQPPDPTVLTFPAIAFLPQRGTHDNFSIGAPDDSSLDVFAPGTVVMKLGEYIEPFGIEVWGPHNPIRTSILAGIVDAMRTGMRSQSLLFQLPNYFNITARISLLQSEHVDDPDVVRNRVKARIYAMLEVPEVKLVNAATLQPYMRNQENPTQV